LLIQRPIWAMSVVMLNVLLQYQLRVTGPSDQEMVEALVAYCANPAFGDRVGPRCADRGARRMAMSASANTASKGGCQLFGSGTEEVVPAGQLSRIRCRCGTKPARPYICRFRSLNLVFVPSMGPLLWGKAQPGDDGVEVLA